MLCIDFLFWILRRIITSNAAERRPAVVDTTKLEGGIFVNTWKGPLALLMLLLMNLTSFEPTRIRDSCCNH